MRNIGRFQFYSSSIKAKGKAAKQQNGKRFQFYSSSIKAMNEKTATDYHFQVSILQ